MSYLIPFLFYSFIGGVLAVFGISGIAAAICNTIRHYLNKSQSEGFNFVFLSVVTVLGFGLMGIGLTYFHAYLLK